MKENMNRKNGARDWLILLLLLALLILVGVVAYGWLTAAITPAAVGAKAIIDYANFTVILLTTVTVLFTIAAVLLAAGSIMGFRTMRRGAAEYARRSVATEIDRAFEQGGAAYDEIRRQFQDPEHPLHEWLRNEIGRQITEQLALYDIAGSGGEPDEEDPRDEGQVT
jgi:hypothetical protein